ncbi:MAG: hypothetical protein KGJ19_04470 [Betaproteobacteria bacterium]|nr:hypothetical protein [Betaproteobacteria bacterium]MDE2309232.1 hypothetical protein [Betaproteobacteria bacterium]
MGKSFQRIGAESNAQVGREFELRAQSFFATQGIQLKLNHKVEVGIEGNEKKLHAFDLGCDEKKILVECKSHRWTTGNNVPSAKMTVWNEAMYYFHAAPRNYRKIMFVLHHCNDQGKSLASYYLDTHRHLIPSGVEFWEYDERKMTATQLI